MHTPGDAHPTPHNAARRCTAPGRSVPGMQIPHPKRQPDDVQPPGMLSPRWLVMLTPGMQIPHPTIQPDDARPQDAQPTLAGDADPPGHTPHTVRCSEQCTAHSKHPACRFLFAHTVFCPLSPCWDGTTATRRPQSPRDVLGPPSSQRWGQAPILPKGHAASSLSKNSGINFHCLSHVLIFNSSSFFLQTHFSVPLNYR